MNAKAKGRRNEHRSMALLEAAGYRCTRSAGSLGEWDIIGIGPTDVVLCQVRTRDWPSTAGTLVVRRYCRKSGLMARREQLHRNNRSQPMCATAPVVGT
jgi:Holliday junction resolvase-like predicted endonuclease